MKTTSKSTGKPKARGESKDSPSVHKGARELTAKQARFVDEYMIDLNATQAAIRAGYSAANAASIGMQQLQKTTVAAEIAKRQAALRDDSHDRAKRNLSVLDRLIEKGEELARDGAIEIKMSDVLKAVEIQNDMLGLKNGGAAEQADVKHTEDLRWVDGTADGTSDVGA